MCVLSLTALATSVGTALASAASATAATASAVASGVSTAAAATGAFLSSTSGLVTMGTLAVGGAVAGGVMGTVSGIQNAEAQKQQAEYQAEIAENNARLAGRRAENIELEANQKRAALLREAQQRSGTARAGYAANGVVLGAGTSAEYEADIANAYDLDLKNLNYDTASESWQARAQAVNDRNAAAAYRAQAAGFGRQKTTSLIGGVINTVASTASAALSVGVGLGQLGGSGTASAAPKADWAINYRPNDKIMLA